MEKSANRVLGGFAVALGTAILIVGKAIGLPFFSGSTPGPGFMTIIVGWGIIICGAAIVLGTFIRRKAKAAEQPAETAPQDPSGMVWIFKKDDLKNFVTVIATSVLVVVLAKVLGLLISMGLGVIVMAKFLGTPSWKTSILVGVGSTAVFFLVFDLFLSVPLPRGFFGF